MKTTWEKDSTWVEDEEAGTTIRAMILGSRFGSDPGCIKCGRKWERGVEQRDEVGNSEQAHTKATLGDIFKHSAQNGLDKIQVTPAATCGQYSLKVKQPQALPVVPAEEVTGDISDDDMHIDYLSGAFAKPEPAAKASAGGKKAVKRVLVADGNADTASKRRASSCSLTIPSGGKSDKLGKQYEEVGKCLTLLTDSQRLVYLASSEGAFSKVTPAQFKGAVDKVAKRLSKNVVAQLSHQHENSTTEGNAG